MRLSYMRNDCLDILKRDRGINQGNYRSPDIWVYEYFASKNMGATEYSGETNIEYDKPSLILPSSPRDASGDLANAKLIHSALRKLPSSLAADERIWAHACHFDFYDYMVSRWPAGSGADILSRYFFRPPRGRDIFRNGMSRLWWFGYLTYDEALGDPYELTAVLLRDQDLMASTLERSFSRNPAVIKTFLRAVDDNGVQERDEQRELIKHLNRIGGVAMLDAIPPERLRELLERKIAEMRRA